MGELWKYARAWWDGLLEPEAAMALVRGRADLPGFGRAVIITIITLLGAYGVSMGLFNSPYAGLISAIKLPMLYLATLLICFPALYVLNHQLGPGLGVRETARLLALAVSANTAALASFTPVSYFFVLTTSDQGYTFLVLMHVCAFALAGLVSVGIVALLFRAACRQAGVPLRLRFLLAWGLLYAFVGSQMSWSLRPWFGAVGVEYTILREREGSFLQAVWGLLQPYI